MYKIVRGPELPVFERLNRSDVTQSNLHLRHDNTCTGEKCRRAIRFAQRFADHGVQFDALLFRIDCAFRRNSRRT